MAACRKVDERAPLAAVEGAGLSEGAHSDQLAGVDELDIPIKLVGY